MQEILWYYDDKLDIHKIQQFILIKVIDEGEALICFVKNIHPRLQLRHLYRKYPTVCKKVNILKNNKYFRM